MSDEIKHECGLAFIRLRKPFSYYLQKYGTPLYGLKKLYLLMEKQHNRGQDGAGVATVKLDVKPGTPYIDRHRSNSNRPIQDVFDFVNAPFLPHAKDPEFFKDTERLKADFPFTGELLIGHV